MSAGRFVETGLLGSTPPGAGPPAASEPVPIEGVLEELDGTPIRAAGGLATSPAPGAASPAAGAMSWARAALAASALALGRPSLWPLALVAFLARGGVLLLAAPMVVLPTLIGLANLVGPASITAGGPGPRLVALATGALVASVVLAAAGTVLAAAAEAALHRATLQPQAGRPPSAPFDLGGRVVTTGRRFRAAPIAAIRLVLLVPLAAAAAVALPAWIGVAYRELTLPTDVAAPLPVRIVVGAPAASALVAGTWLAGEIVGGFAARRSALFGASWLRALVAGIVDPLRAPAGTALTAMSALVLGVITIGASLAALGAAWELARRLLVDEGPSPAAIGGTLLLVGAWIAVLVLAGAAAAWRATLGSAELLRRPGVRVRDASQPMPPPAEPGRHDPDPRSVR